MIDDLIAGPSGLNDPFTRNQTQEKIHVRIQKRNARQNITTVAGLANSINKDLICKEIRKKYCCSGSVLNEEGVLQFTGDQRAGIAEYLVQKGISRKENIIIHGY